MASRYLKGIRLNSPYSGSQVDIRWHQVYIGYMRITVRLEEGIGEEVSRLAGGNLAGWVRGLIEREVGVPADPLASKVERLLGRVDVLEDGVSTLQGFKAMIEEKMKAKTPPPPPTSFDPYSEPRVVVDPVGEVDA